MVLIVDHDPDIARFISVNLQSVGMDTLTAQDGLDGLEKLNQEPDLVLTGIMMPRLDGFEMIRQMRARPFGGPIIVCSAKALEADFTTARAVGADAYLVKPFDPKRLIEVLQLHLAATGPDERPAWSVESQNGAHRL